METLRPTATFPTPYGVLVPVVEHPTVKGEYLFGMDATAVCAGIYDPKQRARFAADARAAGRCDMDRIADYGGGRVVHLHLPMPTNPAYPQLPKEAGIDIPIEAWITALMDQSRWCDRAEVLLNIIGTNFDSLKCNDSFDSILALGLQIMLTSTLEHLAEREIDCIEAAAFYALATHTEWVEPAVEWLRPMRATWWKDWAANRPVYRRFASLCQQDTDLPAWIAGGGI